MKHKWKLDKNGLPDDWAWESGFHNGVYCERCGKCVCIHCHQDWEEMDDCEGDEDEPMSNADRIRAMSDEELLNVLSAPCVLLRRADDKGCPNPKPCRECIAEWLKQLAEE